MTTMVAATTNVVKAPSDDGGCHPCDPSSVETLADRLLWLRDDRFDGSWSRMSRECGLQRTHMNTMFSRLQENPRADIERTTLRKIATGARVRIEWLVDGVRPRDLDEAPGPSIEYDDQYPERARAAAAARVLGTVSEEAIAHVMSIRYASEAGAREISSDEWLAKMQASERDIRRGLLPGVSGRDRTAAPDLDAKPPTKKPKGKK